MNDYCTNIPVFPQFSGTCWLNSILTSCLYSDGLSRIFREKAINDNWENSSDEFKKVFFNILSYINQYKLSKDTIKDREKLKEYLNKLNPDVIILDFVNKYDRELKSMILRLNKPIRKKNFNLGYEIYIPMLNILNYFKINYIDITTYINELKNITLLNRLYNLKTKKQILDSINNPPDVIIYRQKYYILGENYNEDENEDEDDNIYNIKNYNLDIEDIKKNKEIVIINGYKYKIDSVIIRNYDRDNHAISGITCNKTKYVYNGWFKKTRDMAIIDDLYKFNEPCSLMRYDWNINKDESFVLNNNTCKLEFRHLRDYDIYSKSSNLLFFSFGLFEYRYVIYTRIRDVPEPIFSTKILKTKINISKAKNELLNKRILKLPNVENLKSFSLSSISSLSKTLDREEYIIDYILNNNLKIPDEIFNKIEDKVFYEIYGVKTNIDIKYLKEIVKYKFKKNLLEYLSLRDLQRILEISETSQLIKSLSGNDDDRDKIIRLILTDKIILDKDFLKNKLSEEILYNIYYYLENKNRTELDFILNESIKKNNNIINLSILIQLTKNELEDIINGYNKSYLNKDYNKDELIEIILRLKIKLDDNIYNILDNDRLLIINARYFNIITYMLAETTYEKLDILRNLSDIDIEIIFKILKNKSILNKEEKIIFIEKSGITPFIYISDSSNIELYIKNFKKISIEDIINSIYILLYNYSINRRKNELNKLPLYILITIYDIYIYNKQNEILREKLINELSKFRFKNNFNKLLENLKPLIITICKNIYNLNDRNKKKVLKELSDIELLNLIEDKNKEFYKSRKDKIEQLLKEKIEIEKIFKLSNIELIDKMIRNYKSYIIDPLKKSKILNMLKDDEDIKDLIKFNKRA